MGAPLENPYAWVNLTNVLWVEQPVDTGFSIGKVTATSEEDIAQDFIKFFKNFETKFGIKNFKIFVTGESYAGRYVPFISAAMLDEKDKEYYDLNGRMTVLILSRQELILSNRSPHVRPLHWLV